jgi:YVTN family beta-propeller protein
MNRTLARYLLATLLPAAAFADTNHAASDQLAAEAAELAPAFVAAAAPPADPAGAGGWGPVIAWTPHIPVTAATLPDGRLLTFASNQRTTFPSGVEFTYAAVWDPATGQFTEINNPRHDMFCGGVATLADGRVVVNGGRNITVLSSIFDYRTNQWSALPNMNDPRWYNPSVALPDGSVFTVSGSGGINTAESWLPASGWRRLTGIGWSAVTGEAGYINAWHPFLLVAPNGKLFHFGPTDTMHWVETSGPGSLTASGQVVPGSHYPKEGAWAMYGEGRILVAGGGANTVANPAQTDGTTGTSATAAYTVDLNGATPVVAGTASMQYARQFANSVVLPSGEVMVIGGNAGLKFNDTGSILTPELWNPRTGQWRALAAHAVPRNYHSVALLLPDGRVWSGGGGLGGNAADHRDAQIFTPPALLNADGTAAARPTLTAAPAKLGINATFTVTGTSGLAKFALIKMSAATHSVNTDLRYLELGFTEPSAGTYSLSAHPNINVMTPGYWMLFGIAPSGVYSVAKILQIDPTTTVALSNPGNQISVVGGTAALQLAATGPAAVVLAYAATGLPTSLALNGATGAITGTATTAGTYNVAVTASGAGTTATQSFVWTVSAATIVQTFPTFPNANGLTLNGNAAVAAPALRLTKAATNVAGSAFLTSPLPIGANTSFTTRFVFRQWGTSNGADGLAFVIQGNGATALGTGGSGLGYGGVARSLAVEIDSYQSTGDPDANHLGVLTGGNVTTHLATSTPAFDLEDAQSHTAWVEYDGPANTLRVYLAQTVTTQRPALPVITLSSIDLPALVGASAWFGFSAATGSSTNNHDIEAWSLNLNASALPTPPVVASVANQKSVAGNAVSLQVQATDVNGDLLAYSASGLPAGLAIGNTTGLITGTPTTAGTSNVTITVSDESTAPVTTNFAWTVQPPLVLTPLSGVPLGSGTLATFTTQVTGGVNPRYTWSFGDGAADSAYSASPTITHTFPGAGRYIVTVTATDDTGRVVSASFHQAIYAPLTARPPAASGSIAYETRTAANPRLWVVNPDNDSVSVFDPITRAKLAETTVGAAPRAIAIAPNGRVWVTSADASTISILSAVSYGVYQTIALPRGSRPFGIAFDPAGTAAWVTLEATGRLLRIDPVTGAQTASLEVGVNARHLSVNATGTRVYVSRFITPRLTGEETATITTTGQGGQVLAIDTAALTVARTILLQHSEAQDTSISGHGIPNYLGAPAISPDGRSAWVPSKQDNIKRGTLRNGLGLTHESAVRAIASRLDLAAQAEDAPARVDFDNAGMPSAVCFDPWGIYAFTALEASRAIAVIDVWNHVEIVRFPAGRAPQGLTISPDGKTLFAHNFMDRTVTVHDVSAILAGGELPAPTIVALACVAAEKLPAPVLLGKQLFYDAKDNRLALQEYLSCAACHNDGGQDGRVWDFTGFGEGLRNTIALKGHANQGALHWSGNFDEAQDFEGQIRNFAGGLGLIASGPPNPPLGAPNAGRSADLDALAAYLASLTKFGASPARTDAATLPAAALAGRSVFKAQNCASCHGGAQFTNSALNVLRNIGTIKPGSGQRLGAALTGLDVPTLRGLWATAPYLHDGSAATLAAAVSAHAGVALGATDLANLTAYLGNLDDNIAIAPVPLTVALTTPSANVSGRFTVTATFSSAPGGLTLGSITVTNGTAADLAGSGTAYTFAVTPTAGGTVALAIGAGRTQDAEGDGNLASNNLTVTAAPPVTTLTDDFSAGALDAAKWRVGAIFGGQFGPDDPLLTVVQQNGRLEITPRANFATEEYRGIVSAATIDLRGATVSAQVTPTAASTSYLALCAPGGSYLVMAAAAGSLYFEQIVNGTANVAAVPYDAAQHRYWRVRHVPATDRIVWEAGPDGAAWTILYTLSRAIPLGALQIELAAGLDHPEAAPGAVLFDNLRFVANRAPVVANPGAQSILLGQVAGLQISASDPDAQPLTYSASGLPAGLSINAATGRISGTVASTARAANTATVTASDSLLSGSVTFAWTVSAPSALPVTWSSNDLGAPAFPGSGSFASGVYTVTGSGSDIAGTSDQFQYVWQQFVGDGEFIARVPSQANTDAQAKAGVMFRETLQANSRFALLAVTPGAGMTFTSRATTGGVAVQKTAAKFTAPNNWVRLVRAGDTIAGYRSSDGATWTQVGLATIPMSQVINVGLAVTSRSNSVTGTATFDNVRNLAATLPAPWVGRDLGGPALTDLERFAAGTFTVSGGGAGIGGTSDQFHFVAQSLTGDGEIVARVTAQSNTYPWAKAGVMLRDPTAANSPYALMTLTQGNGMYFQWRASAGGASGAVAAARFTAPNNWLRVVRQGNLFTAYRSSTGTTWTLVGTATIPMGPTVSIGLAVAAQDNALISTATFDNVQVKP